MAAILSGALERSSAGRDSGASRGNRWLLAALLALWAAIALPLALGRKTLFLRDVFATHIGAKAFGATELAHGRIPAFDPTWGLGQPFRGNPNVLPFYPGNLLYLFLPFWSAFNLHYALHWLLAFLAMRALSREVGASVEGALLAGLTYAGSGFVLSTMSFYNLLTVAAWWPLAMRGAVAGGRRGVAWGGLACGMALLGGEPLTAAIGCLPLAVAACERHGLIRGLRNAIAVGIAGLGVALPQLVATAEIWNFTKRGSEGLDAAQTAAHALQPLRLLELILPLPWGWPSDFGRFGYFSDVVTPIVPYIYTLHVGIVATALAVVAWRARRAWAALAAGSLLLAWAGGFGGGLLRAATGGIFRYPTKLLFAFTIAAALLAGFGLDAVTTDARALSRRLRFAAAFAFLGGLVLLGLRLPVTRLVVERLAVAVPPAAETAVALWILGLGFAALLLFACALAVARGSRTALVALELVALLPLFPLLSTDDVATFADPPPWAARLGEARAVVPVAEVFPPWQGRAGVGIDDTSTARATRLARLDLESGPARIYGLTYPLAPDLEGMHSPLLTFLEQGLAHVDWKARVRWLRVLGAAWVTREAGEPVDGLERIEASPRGPRSSELDRVERPNPYLIFPERVEAAANPIAAFTALSSEPAPDLVGFASRPVVHRPGGALTLVEANPDRIVFDAAGEGGLAIVQRAYEPLYRARLEDGAFVPTLPADLVLLGIELPAGRHRVTIDVDERPEEFAGAAAAAIVAALLVAAIAPARRSREEAR